MNIAVMNDDGTGNPFRGTTRIDIVSDAGSTWQIERSIDCNPFTLDGVSALAEIHRRMRQLVTELGDCRILVASVIRGIPFAILDSKGFSIWQLEGTPEDLYNHIRQTLREREARGGCVSGCSCGEPTVWASEPQETATGKFIINLRELLADSDMNSQEILIPFLQNRDFSSLEILCDHTPRWLAKDHALFGLVLEETELPDGTYRTVLNPDPSGRKKPSIPYPLSRCGGGRHLSCFEG